MLRDTVHAVCLDRLGRAPNLESPQGYNDLIQWLKIHDQRPEHIVACDKWAVRGWVKERAGEDVLIPATLGRTKRFPAIAKCTHDSGSAKRVLSQAQAEQVWTSLERRLARPYGIEKGEWAYQFVAPQIIAEDLLPGDVVDFKFHCSHDRVRWVQIIRDRKSGQPKETILYPHGAATGLHMDHKMVHAPTAPVYPGDDAWSKLSGLALKLCAGWRYVRVDLYWSGGKALFGELTFWPLAGCYRTQDEPEFGRMLDLDLSYRFEPVVQ